MFGHDMSALVMSGNARSRHIFFARHASHDVPQSCLGADFLHRMGVHGA